MSVAEEDDLKGRDSKGLRPAGDIKRPLDESAERIHYFKLYAQIIGGVAPFLSWLIYNAVQFFSPSLFKVAEERITFITTHQLYWLYFSWYGIFLTRTYMSINANGARLPARVDRPDQHAYKIMSKSKPFADAPYILMDNSGAVGRFNRAQRAASHMDEFLSLFLTASLMGGVVFGPISFLLVLLYSYARVRYANSYTEHKEARLKGLVMLITAEQVAAGLILFIAIKSAI